MDVLHEATKDDADYRFRDSIVTLAGLAAYERAHRPLVAKAQASVPRGAGMLVPPTAAAIWRRNQLTKVIPLAPAARRLLRR